jgi:hypothetical protein
MPFSAMAWNRSCSACIEQRGTSEKCRDAAIPRAGIRSCWSYDSGFVALWNPKPLKRRLGCVT